MGSIIRLPNDNELNQCVQLIEISGPNLYPYIFSVSGEQLSAVIFNFLHMKGMYSKENIKIGESNGLVQGMCLAYPAKHIRKMALKMLLDIPLYIKTFGMKHLLVMLFRLKLNKYFPKTYDDEYFISNIAVYKEYRGKGIGTSLLETIERDAQKEGILKISLFVEIENNAAIKFYLSNGFIEKGRIELPNKYNRYNLYGFIKMIKEINSSNN